CICGILSLLASHFSLVASLFLLLASCLSSSSYFSLGQTLSVTSLSGKRPFGSSVIFLIFLGPKSSTASNVLLPSHHTSTGHATSTVFSSKTLELDIALIASLPASNSTFSTTG